MAAPTDSPPRPRAPRVFFALWPDAAVARRLHAAAGDVHSIVGGRRMRRDTLHLTLAFIGDVAPERLDALRSAAGRVVFQAFTLHIDRLGGWRHNRIAWAGASALPPELAGLVAQLNAALEDAGFPVEARKFAAHVTLVRNARSEVQEAAVIPAIEWHVGEFALMESDRREDGAHYTAIGRWCATPPAAS